MTVSVTHLLDALPQAPLLRAIGGEAEDLQIEAYAVGGMVRDMLLGLSTTDIDVVTVGSGSGIRLARAVGKRLGGRTVHVYQRFGTAAIRVNQPDGEQIVLEFVATRRESYRRTSRNPIVEDGTLQEDLERRDFTVNAMAACLLPDRYGELIDPHGGQEHLEEKRIVTPRPPRKTFEDDPLRMIRAARFAAQLGFTVDTPLHRAMCQEAHRVDILTQERITEELERIVDGMMPSEGLRLLESCGILQRIFPELAALRGVETAMGQRHKDNFFHTLKVLDNLIRATEHDPPEYAYWLRWAALLHDIAKPLTKRFVRGTGWTFHGHEDRGSRMVPKIFRRLKLPLDERMEYVRLLVALHHRPVALVDDAVTDSAVRRLLFDAGDAIDDLMILVRADITSRNPHRVRRYLQAFDRVEVKFAEIEAKDNLRAFRPPVDGLEIMELVGTREGVAVGLIKSAVQEAILDGTIPNERDAAIALVMELKEDALRRGRLFDATVAKLRRAERRASQVLKEAVLYGELPADEDEALAHILALKAEVLASPTTDARPTSASA